jgi:glycosyltransferase involved in cell wall biosynthesis
MRIALVHYWLVGLRGGEKVLEALCELYPEADIFTHIYDADAVGPIISAHNVTTSFIAKLPFARRLYRMYLPLMPFALEALDLSQYDLVISSESGPAKGVLTRPDAIHVCYCHTPMRYLWDQYHLYRSSAGPAARLMMPVLAPFLRLWDVVSANRVDHFIANSRFVAKRIQKTYRRDAEVISPPVKFEEYDIEERPTLDYYFFISQLEAYKRVDLVIEAANRLGLKLIVVGTGSEEERLRRLAGPTVTFLGKETTQTIAKLYKNCRALLYAGIEDFGIVFLEAMASGRPVIAYGTPLLRARQACFFTSKRWKPSRRRLSHSRQITSASIRGRFAPMRKPSTPNPSRPNSRMRSIAFWLNHQDKWLISGIMQIILWMSGNRIAPLAAV